LEGRVDGSHQPRGHRPRSEAGATSFALSEAAEPQLLAATAGARSHDRLADLRRAIAVLEGHAVRCDVAALGDRAQEVRHLAYDGVSPPDDVTRRPPEIHERMVRLRH